jgi:hypothetical protein
MYPVSNHAAVIPTESKNICPAWRDVKLRRREEAEMDDWMTRRLIGWLLLPAADAYDIPGLGFPQQSVMDWSCRMISVASPRPRSHGPLAKSLTLALRDAHIAAISVDRKPEDREVVTTYLHLALAMYYRRDSYGLSWLCPPSSYPTVYGPCNSVLLSPQNHLKGLLKRLLIESPLTVKIVVKRQ